MKKTTLWIVIGGIALFVLGIFGGMFMPFGWNNSAYGFNCANGWNSYGMMGYRGSMPMMGGWGWNPLGMLSIWLVPLLVIGGIVWLVYTLIQKRA